MGERKVLFYFSENPSTGTWPRVEILIFPSFFLGMASAPFFAGRLLVVIVDIRKKERGGF